MMLIILGGCLFIGVATMVAIFGIKRTKKLTKEKQNEFRKILRNIENYTSQKEKIIDSDKLYHKILYELGYTGTFGDILKRNPKIINNIEKIWELHKLRNTLVHDFHNWDDKILSKKGNEYINEIEKLLSANF